MLFGMDLSIGCILAVFCFQSLQS
uniref:Uncharacterized protein n=1 Tax=Arundo donax TaxID=35708 RepID=A0A0A9GJR9_ARUDO